MLFSGDNRNIDCGYNFTFSIRDNLRHPDEYSSPDRHPFPLLPFCDCHLIQYIDRSAPELNQG